MDDDTAEAVDEKTRKLMRGAGRVAAASDDELANEAAENEFSVATYRLVVTRLAAAAAPPGTDFTALDDLLETDPSS